MREIKVYNLEKVKERLFELRTEKNLSQKDLGKKLNEILNIKMNKDVNLDGENGKQTVSQLERKNSKRNLTYNLAFAYAHIFDVSLDYILGWSDDFNPEYKNIKEYTGLSNEAIHTLKELNTKSYFLDEGDIKNNFRINKLSFVPKRFLE